MFSQALEERRQNFESELEKRKKDLTDEQLGTLMNEHQQQLDLLERNMDSEKQRQISTLQDKIAERKRKRETALAAKHEAEMSKELMKQQQERNKLESQQVCSEIFPLDKAVKGSAKTSMLCVNSVTCSPPLPQ